MSRMQEYNGLTTLFHLKHELSVMLFDNKNAHKFDLIEQSIKNVNDQIHNRIKLMAH
ncbi:hypothetical protein PBC5_011 [Bacillus phage PBC5]|nr:hypothetical protein PBC5_011 [Bacillus phage PBC5]